MRFQLIASGDVIVADGYTVFGQYVVSWRGELPQYRMWDSIEDAVETYGSNLTVRWL